MELLTGYGSDGSGGSSDAEGQLSEAGQVETTDLTRLRVGSKEKGRAVQSAAAVNGVKRRVVDYKRLPVSRPLALALGGSLAKGTTAAGSDEEPPLKRAAELDAARPSAGRSLLASLPPPKATLGSEAAQSGSLRLDLSGVTRLNEAPTAEAAGLIGCKGIRDENGNLPESALSHPMFNDENVIVTGDGPTQEELEELRGVKSFKQIQAEDMRDPDWYMNNQVSGGPGLHRGKRVPLEISMYESSKWQQTTHSNPTRIQKRKHQINWLANEAMDKEAELLDRNATSKLTKSQTQMKYGW